MTLALLSLTQILSPAFPTGAYAYSHGLETVIAQGVVRDADGFAAWLADILEHGTGWQDAVLMAAALRDDADLDSLDALARALAPCAERLQESVEQGAALARVHGAIHDANHTARPWPLAVAEAAKPLGLPVETIIALALQAFAGNLCTIATRHVPLGQTQGQAILAAMAPRIEALAKRAAASTLADLGSGVWAAEIAAMQHETQNVRIFRT